MRISEETRFPHPVLGLETGDFTSGEFDMTFRSNEDLETGALTLEHDINLTETGIRELVKTGKAAAGCIVRCTDTYHTELRTLAWPSGRSDFAPGTLLNRVTLRPVIWLNGDLPHWDPGTIHPEFSPPVLVVPCGGGGGSRRRILRARPRFFSGLRERCKGHQPRGEGIARFFNEIGIWGPKW